jgi:methionine-rich copper-binding protein CopC
MHRASTLIATLSLLASAGTALAHAQLESASPAVGSTVRKAPSQVSLSFTQKLEKSFSSIEVSGPGGRVDQGGAAVSGARMSVGLKALLPGTYHVHWRALSVDTHKTEGSFAFTVGK